MKALKYLVLSIIVLVFVAVAGLAVTVFTVDPNRIKPIIESAAARQGLTLKMTGDISWQLYPKLGLSLGQIALSEQKSGELMTSIKNTKASVQLMPLFKRQILVDGVELDGLELFYTIEKDGGSAWSSVLDAPSDSSATKEDAGASDMPELSVNIVRVKNSIVHYHDKQAKQKALINLIKLYANNITLDGRAFPVDLIVKAEYNDFPSAQIDWEASVALNLEAKSVQIPLSQMHVQVAGAKVDLDVSTQTSWADPLASEGVLQIKPFDLPSLLKAFAIAAPETKKPSAFKKVSTAFDYSLTGEKLALNNINVGIDNFKLQGQVNVVSFSAPSISVDLKGTSMVLDDYLPPSSDELAEPVQAVSAPPVPLPMDLLKGLHFDAKILVDQLSYAGLILSDNQIYAAANKGVLRLDQLSSEVAEGSFYMDALLNAAGTEAKLTANVRTKKINIGTILKTFAELDQLQGLANTEMSIKSHGKTDKQLVDNVEIVGSVDSEGVNITPFNIEQQFCSAIALLHQEQSPSHDWPKKTELEPVALKFHFSKNTLRVDSLSAEVAHLTGAADGSINIESGVFDIPLAISLGDFAGDIKGCLPIEDKWRKQTLPLRCKGNLNEIGAKTCLPDTKLIGNLIKDRVKEKVKAKVEEKKQEEIDKVEKKAKEKAQELLKKQLGDENVKEAEDSLRGLFKKFKDK